jgi:chromosome segregation ATPase
VAGALYSGTMSKATEPTLHDVLRELRALRADHGARLGGIGEHLEGIDGRLASHGEHLEGIDGRLASHGEHLEGIDGRLASHGEHLEGIDARMDSLEHSVTEVLGDGLANVQAAVENFAATKADRTELEAVRADVDALKEAAG